MKNIVVLSGSIRIDRKSHWIACLIFEQLSKNKSIKVTLLDLKEYPFPLLEDVPDYNSSLPKGLLEFSDHLSGADGIVIVSPEYKNGIPGALKNALDYLKPQLLKRIPLGIATVSSGGFGGVNCLSQLRLVGLALGGMPIPEKLCVSYVNQAITELGINDAVTNETALFVKAFLEYLL